MIQKLPAHEWLIISLLLALLGSLIAIAYIRKGPSFPQTSVPHALVDPFIQVTIQGAVAKPGSYTLEKGALVSHLLELAEVLPEADLKRLKVQNKLKDGQKINISLRPMITIFIEGAVEKEGPLQVRVGTRVEDLLTLLRFKPEADLKKLQKKRYLKDQEVIQILEKVLKKRASRSDKDS